mmetsp:Transcript_17434/g.51768  ORF Transcript_17434/g.51768 Transcript_17434/m.51768 type:complete len:343 (-) Transcript_17434:897-1925(-)
MQVCAAGPGGQVGGQVTNARSTPSLVRRVRGTPADAHCCPRNEPRTRLFALPPPFPAPSPAAASYAAAAAAAAPAAAAALAAAAIPAAAASSPAALRPVVWPPLPPASVPAMRCPAVCQPSRSGRRGLGQPASARRGARLAVLRGGRRGGRRGLRVRLATAAARRQPEDNLGVRAEQRPLSAAGGTVTPHAHRDAPQPQCAPAWTDCGSRLPRFRDPPAAVSLERQQGRLPPRQGHLSFRRRVARRGEGGGVPGAGGGLRRFCKSLAQRPGRLCQWRAQRLPPEDSERAPHQHLRPRRQSLGPRRPSRRFAAAAPVATLGAACDHGDGGPCSRPCCADLLPE